MAVADRPGMAGFMSGGGSSMGHIAATGQRRVSQISLDHWVSTGRFPVPDYVKIAIEGAATLALQGARSTLARYRPTIFLATHGAPVHAQCCGLLQELGYTLTSRSGENVAATDELLATAGQASGGKVK